MSDREAMSDEQISEGLRLADAATPGPWEHGGPWPSVSVIVCVEGAYLGSEGTPEQAVYEPVAMLHQETVFFDKPPPEQAVKDAAFIAAARTLLPAALTELRSLRTRLAALEAKWRDLPDGPGIWARPNYPAIRANWVYPGDDMPPELLYGEGRPVSALPRGYWSRVAAAPLPPPAAPQGLDLPTGLNAQWRTPASDMTFEDGNQYLVAVPVCRESRNPSAGHYYEYSVVTVHCDSETAPLFDVNGGDSWGWDWSDVEAYVPLSEFRIGVARLPAPVVDEAARLSERYDKLYAACIRAEMAVMETSGDWSLHDVSERGKDLERQTYEIINKNLDLESRLAASESARRVAERERDRYERRFGDCMDKLGEWQRVSGCSHPAAIEKKLSASEQAGAAMREALGLSSPWPVQSVLKTLIDASRHLLDDHQCDQHGYENVRRAIGEAERMVDDIDAALAQPQAEGRSDG